jgi:hypothetical protein
VQPPNLTPTQLRNCALLYWPPQIRAEVASQSFLDTMMATYPLFRQVMHDSRDFNSLLANIRILNNSNELPMNVFLRHCMLFSDLGWEAIKKWFGDAYAEVFPEGLLTAQNLQQAIPLIRQGKIRTSSAHITSSYDYALKEAERQQIEALIFVLFYGSDVNDQVMGKCNLAVYLSDDGSLFDADSQVKYIQVSRQTGGAAAAIGGSLLENRIAIDPITELLSTEYPNLRFSMSKEHEFATGQRMTSDQWFVSEVNNRAVALEVSFQETTNSTIERKRRDAQNRQRLFPINVVSAFVLDGVGTLDHRHNAVRDIIQYSDIVVSARPDQVEYLGRFIGNFLSGN